jgi:hypothetical protein
MNIKRGITYLSGVRDGRYNRENCGFEKSWECNDDFSFAFLNCLQKKSTQELMDFWRKPMLEEWLERRRRRGVQRMSRALGLG